MQDRLVKELRLAKEKILEEANVVLKEYLRDHNKRFEVEAKSRANMHRKKAKGMKLKDVFCIKSRRKLKNDNKIVKDNKLYQINEYVGTKDIEVWEHFDGSMNLVGNGRKLKYKQIKDIPVKKRVLRSVNRFKSPRKERNKSFGNAGIRKKPHLSYA
ncbi:MAG: hypothetical protein ACI8Q2_000760 [Candidatus Omnitrophota bacterium]|jgi:hypothetical protein